MAMAKRWTRQIVNQVVVLRIQGAKVRPPCKIWQLHHFCHICRARPPTPMPASAKSNIFVPDPSTNPQVNQFTDQFAALLGPKISSMPGQINLSNTHVPQKQNLPQFNFHKATHLPNTHFPINFSSSPNRNVKPLPVIAPHHLVNSKVPTIPPSIAPQVPTLKKPTRNPVCSPQTHPLPCLNVPKLPLNRKPGLNVWRFPHNKPPNANTLSDNATVLNNF